MFIVTSVTRVLAAAALRRTVKVGRSYPEGRRTFVRGVAAIQERLTWGSFGEESRMGDGKVALAVRVFTHSLRAFTHNVRAFTHRRSLSARAFTHPEAVSVRAFTHRTGV